MEWVENDLEEFNFVQCDDEATIWLYRLSRNSTIPQCLTAIRKYESIEAKTGILLLNTLELHTLK